MGINIRTKGATAERDVANALNEIIYAVLRELGQPLPVKPPVQRNQNQSAVGGDDLTGTFGLAIEVKRQEQLSINTWWAQCIASAARNDRIPVLIYKQNHKAWRVVMLTSLELPSVSSDGINDSSVYLHSVRATIELEDFHRWFKEHVRYCILRGDPVVN